MAKVDLSKWNKRLRAMESSGVAMEDVYEDLIRAGFVLKNNEVGSNKPVTVSSKYEGGWISNKSPEERKSFFDKLDNIIPSSRNFENGYYGMQASTETWTDLFDDFWGDYYEGNYTPEGLKITNFDNKGFSDEDLDRIGEDISEFAHRAARKMLKKGEVVYYKQMLKQALEKKSYSRRYFPTSKERK